jgi:hypothetical protein
MGAIALPSLRERKAAFDAYCKQAVQEQRSAKLKPKVCARPA